MVLSWKPASLLGRGWMVTALLVLLQPLPCPAEADSSGPPEILSLFPLGGRPGEEFQGTLRGRRLEGARELWFDSGGVRATVLGLRNEDGPKPVRDAPVGRRGQAGPVAQPEVPGWIRLPKRDPAA